MDTRTQRRTRLGRRPIIVVTLALILGAAATPTSLLAADPSPMTSGDPTPTAAAASVQASQAPGEALCASAADMRTIVGFVQGTDVEAEGWVPIFVGLVAGLSEARGLLGLVDETYRPLVDELITSLQDLRSITYELRQLDTLGSQVAAVGEAITEIGNDMDALSEALREPCPVEP
jgi:hypothetical protein